VSQTGRPLRGALAYISLSFPTKPTTGRLPPRPKPPFLPGRHRTLHRIPNCLCSAFVLSLLTHLCSLSLPSLSLCSLAFHLEDSLLLSRWLLICIRHFCLSYSSKNSLLESSPFLESPLWTLISISSFSCPLPSARHHLHYTLGTIHTASPFSGQVLRWEARG
jgi:hypothetical protein